MTRLSYAAALLSALSAVNGHPAEVTKRDLLTGLPEKADPTEMAYQPYFDFDTDGCYQTAAIDPSGKMNPGLPKEGGLVTGGCRDPSRLQNANTYSRRRCNNGVCGIVYAYYYEKDAPYSASAVIGGHTHDWEHVVVFTGAGDKMLGAAVSQHKGYETRKAGEYPTSADGKRPIVVYHKDGGSTHCHRFANNDDVQHYENYTGNSFRAKLVGWWGWPSNFRDLVMGRNWGDAVIAINDANFAANLDKAGAKQFGLDPNGPDE